MVLLVGVCVYVERVRLTIIHNIRVIDLNPYTSVSFFFYLSPNAIIVLKCFWTYKNRHLAKLFWVIFGGLRSVCRIRLSFLWRQRIFTETAPRRFRLGPPAIVVGKRNGAKTVIIAIETAKNRRRLSEFWTRIALSRITRIPVKNLQTTDAAHFRRVT